MSGFARGTDRGPYELLALKALRWHSHRRDDCATLEQMMDTHVRPYFTAELTSGGSYLITGPTLEAGSTNMLYSVLSGYESNETW